MISPDVQFKIADPMLPFCSSVLEYLKGSSRRRALPPWWSIWRSLTPPESPVRLYYSAATTATLVRRRVGAVSARRISG